MEASSYQKAVYRFFEQGSGHGAVISVAGSGKTTTAIKGIGHVSQAYNVLLGAFNTSIRDEFTTRCKEAGYTNVKCVNYNGFGWRICSDNLPRLPELDKLKSKNILEFVILKGMEPGTITKTIQKMGNAIERMVSLCKSLNLHSVEEVAAQYNDIIDDYGVEPPEDKDFKDLFLKTYGVSITHMDHFDFDDQKFMPLHLGWDIPAFDRVVIDEFQDTCPVEMELMLRAGRHGRTVAFGDPDQAIYGFKGATPDAFNVFKETMNAIEMPLSICYRCPKAVIYQAQEIVSRIEPANNAIDGDVLDIKRNEFFDKVKPKDFVLCRTNDELVRAQIELTKRRIPAKVRGRELGTAVEYLINKVSKGEDLPIAAFITRLKDYEMDRCEQLRSLRREKEIQNISDRCNSIRALADEASRVSELKKILAEVFTDDFNHGGVDLMSIHKSKGLQAKNVFILRPDLLPHPAAMKRPKQLAEEARLKYVAITRAEETLTWVEEDE